MGGGLASTMLWSVVLGWEMSGKMFPHNTHTRTPHNVTAAFPHIEMAKIWGIQTKQPFRTDGQNGFTYLNTGY